MNNVPHEVIELEADVSYKPFLVPNKRYGKFWRIGEDAQQGQAVGAVFKMTFVDLSLATATHIKIWGTSHQGDDAPEIPITYFIANPEYLIYLWKFEFTDGAGTPVAEATSAYQILGAKTAWMPAQGFKGE